MKTGGRCLSVMVNMTGKIHGDWNDAVSGLGESSDGEEFGSGVSVMATLQLYKALKDMSEILEMVDGHEKNETNTQSFVST